MPPPIFGTAKNQIPGYGGFVPNVQSKNMYGKTQYDATTEALELVASAPQRPKWFVSHWWGEPVALFLRCLEQHAKDHGA